MCKMFLNYFIFVLTASVLAGNVSGASTPVLPGEVSSSTTLQNVSGNISDASNTNSHGANPATPGTNLSKGSVPDLNNTKEETINTNQTNVHHDNASVIKITANDNVVDKNAANNTDKSTVDNNNQSDKNGTTNNNNTDENTANNADRSTLDKNIVVDHNKTANVNTLDNNTVNKTNEHQQNTTGGPALNNSHVTGNVTEKPNLNPRKPSQKPNDNSTVVGQQTSAATNVTGNVTEKPNLDPRKPSQKPNDNSTAVGQQTSTNNNSTQRNISAATNVHGNESAKLTPGAPSKANVTATSNQPTTASSGDSKWKAILITATVVIVGCCGVLLVKRSLQSERGRSWLERTRRQANMPCRDYEVQYLVIRDSDD